MIKLVMDSAGDLPAKLLEKLDIRVVPINIHFGEQHYQEGVDIDSPTFYRKVSEEKIVPQTAQPSPYQFAEVYRQVARETGATEIISVHVTSQLSGTHASSLIAAREVLDKVTVYPFDSRSGSGGQGMMTLEAARMAISKVNAEKILERLDYMRDNMNIYLVLDNLEFAKMSGRVGSLAAALSSLLRVKPLIQVQDGMMDVKEKVRTQKKALDRMVELVKDKIGDRLASIAVIHAEAPEIAEGLAERVKAEFNVGELFVEKLSIGLAVHFGPGTVALVACPVE